MNSCDSSNISFIDSSQLFNALPQSLLFLNAEKKVFASNTAFNNLFENSGSVLKGLSLESLFEGDNEDLKFPDEPLPAIGILWLRQSSGNRIKVVAQRSEFLVADSIASIMSIYPFTEEGLGSHFVAGITSDGCWVWDVLRSTTWRSSRWLEIAEMTHESAKMNSEEVSRKFEFINASEKRDAVRKKLMGGANLAEGEGYLKCVDGVRKHISWQGLVVAKSLKGEPLLSMGSIRDMTPFVARNTGILQARDNTAHQARLLQLGETLAAVSHELNQPLSAIASYASVCKRNMNLDMESAQILSQIETQALRAGTLLRRIREFAQYGERNNRVSVSIEPILADVVDWMKTDWRCRDMHFQILASPEIARLDLKISCHRVEIEQIIINLIINASAAVRSLEVESKTIDSQDIIISVKPIDLNKLLEVTIADRGPGISDVVLETLFTPFATTRSDGLGLGLSISKSIADELNGTLRYQSRSGGGALFLLTIPVCNIND